MNLLLLLGILLTGLLEASESVRLQTMDSHRSAQWESLPVPVLKNRLYTGRLTVNVIERTPGAAMSVRLLLLDDRMKTIQVVAESSSPHQALFSCGKADYIRYSPGRHEASFMKLQVILAGNPAKLEIGRPVIGQDQLTPPFKGIYSPKTPYPDRDSTLAEMRRLRPAAARLVRKNHGRMAIEIDGRESWLKSYKGSIDYGPMAKHGTNFILTFAAGVNLFWDKMSWDLSPYRGKGGFDFTHLENELMLIHKTAPEARVLLNIDLDPGPEFFADHPDSIFRNEKGELAVRQFYGFAGFGVPGPKPEKHRHWIVSYGSEDYLQYACSALEKVAEFLKKSPAGNIVAGFGLQGGHDAQYLQWEYSAARGQADYSPDNIRTFRRWLRKKYGAVQKLQNAWENQNITFENASLFTEKEWKSRACWTDGKTGLDRKIIDGREFMTYAIAELNRRFARTLKKSMNRPVVVGTYYSTPIWGQAGRSSLCELSQNQGIDMVFQVSGYSTLRKVGAIGATANFAIAAAHLSDMVFLQEMDHRTIRSQMTAPEYYSRLALCYPKTSEEFRNQIFRDAGAVLAYGGDGYYYFDMFDSWYNDPEALKVIETTNRAADWSLRYRNSVPGTRAAVFLDERQRLLSRNASGAAGYTALVCRMSGITPDIYLLQNLTSDRLPDYDLWILPDPQTLTRKQLQVLQKKAQTAGKVLLVTGSPGALQSAVPGRTEEVMAALGMTVQDHLKSRRASVEFLPEAGDAIAENCHDRIGLQDLFIRKDGGVLEDPLPFYATVNDPEAAVLARWAGTGEPAMAVRRRPGKGTLLYAAHPCGLTPQLVCNAAKEAGLTPLAEPGNSLAAGHGVIAVHRLDKPVKLNFAEEMEFVEPSDGRSLGTGRSLDVECGYRESRLICYRKKGRK